MSATAQKSVPTVEELWLRPDMNINEAVRATGRCWKTLKKWIDDKEVQWYQDGKCIRILTDSIRDRSRRLASEQSGGGQW